jgi:hypothetical protein
MAGKLGVLGMYVDRLDEASKRNQQYTRYRQNLAQTCVAHRTSNTIQTERP